MLQVSVTSSFILLNEDKRKTAEKKISIAKQGDPSLVCCRWPFAGFLSQLFREVPTQQGGEFGTSVLSSCRLSSDLCTIAMQNIIHACFSLPFFSLFTPVPHFSPPTQLVTATRWARRARRATRPQDSVPARTASPASPATAAPKATSRVARRWLPASVSSSHSLSVGPELSVAWYQSGEQAKVH